MHAIAAWSGFVAEASTIVANRFVPRFSPVGVGEGSAWHPHFGAGSLLTWRQELARLKEWMSAIFGRRELLETSEAFIDGLLSGIARKTGWMLAEQAGAERPYRMQSLPGRSRCEADALRDPVRDYGWEGPSVRKRTVGNENTGQIRAISPWRTAGTFCCRDRVAVYCVHSWRATRNGPHSAARPSVLHAANRGSNAGDDIASQYKQPNRSHAACRR